MTSMQLFNRKTLARHFRREAIPAEHARILESWAAMIREGRVRHLKEVALHGEFKSKIVEAVLGYRGPASGADYTVSAEQTIIRGSVDLALGHFGDKKAEIVAPFELKGADTRDLDAIMPGRNKSPVQQAWEYATNARGVKWVLVSNMLELRLYGFGEGTGAYEVFRFEQLAEPEEYARFMLLLSAENLLSGKTQALLEQSRREDKDITGRLYQDYKALRLQLIAAVQVAHAQVTPLQSIALAQKILDRVLFIAFAEDAGLLPRDTLASAFANRNPYNPHSVWSNFTGLFRAIDKGNAELGIPRYNGGLFADDAAINALALPDGICEAFKKLGEYDFASEVSVTVLGHIFEQSIADVERLQAAARDEVVEEEKASGTSGRRKRDGVVYTPDYIARFIVAETLGAHLRELFDGILREHAKKDTDISDYANITWRRKTGELDAWLAWRERLKGLRIVDPACGSGVFLIMAFDFMKAELTRVNDKIAELQGTRHSDDLLDSDSEILTRNLFGVDVNLESVEIAKLSLWIKTAKPGKVLDTLDGSLRVGDSLIEDANFAYLDHAFNWHAAFPQVFAEGGFDVVLGNPPYVRMELLKPLKPYLEERYEVVSDRADLYCYFYERGIKLLKPGGRLGFISSNTFFKTGSGRPLREFLLREATLESVVDFGDLQVFDGVTTYPAIVTLRRGAAAEQHLLRFWKVAALPDSNFNAEWQAHAAPFPQSALGAGSWELEGDDLRRLREKIRAGRRTLKQVYGAPLRGVVTGLNDAFVIDTPTKQRLCRQDARSAELLKPFLEGKDLKRWRVESRGLWLIYIPKNKIDIDDYPAIRDWLLPYQSALEKRATKQAWFELQQAQEAYSAHFSSEKISYPHFNNERNFSFEPSGAFSNDKSYLVPTNDKALLALLNSKLAWFILASMSPPVRGGFHELRVQYVETAPIPDWNEAQKSDLADLADKAGKAARERLDRQQAFARRILDLHPADDGETKLNGKLREWWALADFAAFRREAKKLFKQDIPLKERGDWEDLFNEQRAAVRERDDTIAAAEASIDRIVYGLFGLDAEEIALLEAAGRVGPA